MEGLINGTVSSKGRDLAESRDDPATQSPLALILPHPTSKRHGARNQHKMKHFAKWLQENFPEAFMDDKHDKTCDSEREPYILDVAGGKGELTARLVMCHRRRVVMVDPRPCQPEKVFHERVLRSLPKKWQQRVEHQVQLQSSFVQDIFQARFRQIQHVFTDETIEHDQHIREAALGASLWVGMHADGATEPIVDGALKLGIPFVVVPCCVFPNFYPNRQLPGRRAVRTYDDFIEYLMNKDPRLEKVILPFEGRNVAIYWTGEGRAY